MVSVPLNAAASVPPTSSCVTPAETLARENELHLKIVALECEMELLKLQMASRETSSNDSSPSLSRLMLMLFVDLVH